MPISIFEMFRVGIGPSSSHTVGPMRAAGRFMRELQARGDLPQVARLTADLMGSLGATGRGHATDQAVLLGFMGETPENVDTVAAHKALAKVVEDEKLPILGGRVIAYAPYQDITFSPDHVAQYHTNGLQLAAYDAAGRKLLERRFYSVGGGFVVEADADNFEHVTEQSTLASPASKPLPYNYANAAELVAMARRAELSIAQVVRANERTHRTDEEINQALDHVWAVMSETIARGLAAEGDLPGHLHVARRAKQMAARLVEPSNACDTFATLNWVNVWAFATGEENACGGRLVTCPTNGAAAVLPAVLNYYVNIMKGTKERIRDFLLTAGAVGMLYKENASISGAEVGCQGEVGVACSMAAAGLAAVLDGSVGQVEEAAEIGMEHNLGLTCDPVNGQVQIPCIERNAVAAVKAIDAAHIALLGDGTHVVSLDNVMRTMYQTGRDMQSKYKETSRGGLAINVVEC